MKYMNLDERDPWSQPAMSQFVNYLS